MYHGQSVVLGMNRHAIRPGDISKFLAQRQVTARRLVKVEIYGADEVEFGLLPDGAFEVKNQAGLIIPFGSREAIAAIITAGDTIYFKATPSVVTLSWARGLIRQLAALPSLEPGGEPATDIYLGAPVEARLVQYALLPDDTIELLSPAQGQGVMCVRFIKEFGLLLAIGRDNSGRPIRIASRQISSANELPWSRRREQVWDDIAQSPDNREIVFLGRPRSMKSGRIHVPVSIQGGHERELTLFMDGDRPGIPRWSDPRVNMHQVVGAVDGKHALRASFLPGSRRSILRLESV